MNIIFYLLIASSIAFSVFKAAPEGDGQVQAEVLTVAAPNGLMEGAPVDIEGPDGIVSAKVQSIKDGKALISVALPDGTVHLRYPTLPIAAVGKAALDSAKSAVDLALGLVGAMTLFMGLMKVVEAAGGLNFMARALRPIMVRLFPDVPPEHPAMGAMIMNLAANVIGLGNAATPFGLKAMQELETLNPHPGTATNAMVLFLAINTSGVAVLPTGMIGVRAILKSQDPASIFVPTLLATSCSTVGAVIASKLLERVWPPPVQPKRQTITVQWREYLPVALVVGVLGGLVALVMTYEERASVWIVPGLILGMLTSGIVQKVKVYECFIEGAREAFSAATRIIPFLVAILVAVGMFRASGAMDALTEIFTPLCRLVGMPPEVFPLALLRPLSGSGALALTTELNKTYGPDSLIGVTASTLNGSTETTFYVLAVYFGAIGIQRSRHAVINGLVADLCGALGAVWFVRWLVF